MKAIEFNEVSFCYEKEVGNVINDLSFEINEGDFCAVVGRNGSGKSTLARLTNGLLKTKNGSICVLGIKTSENKMLFEIRKNCGIVFQNPDNQMVASIVEDDIVFGPENIGVSREEIASRLEFALSSTKTEQFRDKMASSLSGGQKQRVAIAGVLALRPKILILDESTSMLDPVGRKSVMEVVKELNKKENMTVLVITHYMDEVVDCDKVLVIDNGQLLFSGTPRQVFSEREILKKAGLELPLPLQISLKLNQGGLMVGENLSKEELGDKLCELLQRI